MKDISNTSPKIRLKLDAKDYFLDTFDTNDACGVPSVRVTLHQLGKIPPINDCRLL